MIEEDCFTKKYCEEFPVREVIGSNDPSFKTIKQRKINETFLSEDTLSTSIIGVYADSEKREITYFLVIQGLGSAEFNAFFTDEDVNRFKKARAEGKGNRFQVLMCDYSLEEKINCGVERITETLKAMKYLDDRIYLLGQDAMAGNEHYLAFLDDIKDSIFVFERKNGELLHTVDISRRLNGRESYINGFAINDERIYLYLMDDKDRGYVTNTDVLDFNGNLTDQYKKCHLRFTPEGEAVKLMIETDRKQKKYHKKFTINYRGSDRFAEDVLMYRNPKFIFNNKGELFVMYYPNTQPGYYIAEDSKIPVYYPHHTRQPFCFLDSDTMLFTVNTKYRTYQIDDGRTYPADIHFAITKLVRGAEH